MKRDFLHITDFSKEEIDGLFELSARLKKEVKEETPHHLLKGKTLAMIFQKASARTRVSFETGMFQLGGHALFLGPDNVGLGKREATRDLARLFSRYNDLIMARVFDHEHIIKLAKHASVPVINGLTDYNHPCQIMADIFTVLEHRGHLDDFTLSFIGDGNNVFHSWMYLAQRLPMKLNLACPEGYEPDEKLVGKTRSAGLSEVTISHDPFEIVAGSDVIYTDVWASMGQESETDVRQSAFNGYTVDPALMERANEGALFMHDMPAHYGEEVPPGMLDHPQSVAFPQAHNRLHAQKSILEFLLTGN